MRHPVNKVYITQKWGVNGDVYKRFGYKGHNGQDYRLFDEQGNKSTTALLYSPHSGKVLERASDPDGYGNYLKIENDQEGSILGHLLSFKVSLGQEVKEGELLGWCDNTGWSTGSHLHWGYYRKPRNKSNGYGGTIDPTPYIKPENEPIGGHEDMIYQDFYNEFMESFKEHKNDIDWGYDKHKMDKILEDLPMVDRIFDAIANARKKREEKLQSAATYAGKLETDLESCQKEVERLKKELATTPPQSDLSEITNQLNAIQARLDGILTEVSALAIKSKQEKAEKVLTDIWEEVSKSGNGAISTPNTKVPSWIDKLLERLDL